MSEVTPCYQCICVPVCRHRAFHNLYFTCDFFRDYLNHDDSDERYLLIESSLKPTVWKVSKRDKYKVQVIKENLNI